MSDIVWVSDPTNLYEYALDLHTCLRFSVHLDEDGRDFEYYYLTPEGKWVYELVAHPPSSLRDELVSYNVRDWTGYKEQHPIEVAFRYLKFDREYVGERFIELTRDGETFVIDVGGWRLPPQLEPYREIASNVDLYLEWKNGERKDRILPRWDKRERILWIGDQECKRLRSKAYNQEKVLDELQAAGWPTTTISNPLRDRELLRQTVKDFNRSLHSNAPFRLLDDGPRVGWFLI
jgi:hypothetical protein